MIRVLIADDQDILREGLKMLLQSNSDIDVCGSVENGKEAVAFCQSHKVDVILMDMKMPELNGVEATKRIKQQFESIKILVLTTFNDDEYIFESIKYGASGYLLKDAAPAEIINAIKTIHSGGSLIQPEVASRLLNKFSEMAMGSTVEKDKKIEQLTKRELKICSLLAEGYNNKEISQSLYISEGTVKNHITNILNKLELRDRTQLAVYAVKNGL